MTKDFIIHHYHCMSRWKILPRIIRKLSHPAVAIILDLEDSVSNPFDQQKTKLLKDNARNGLKQLATQGFFQQHEINYFIRINSISTEFFEDDLHLISELVNNNLLLPNIILPKTNSWEDIDFLLNHPLLRTDNSQIKLNIVPIVETVNGLKNLSQIVKFVSCLDQDSKVIFGLIDYSLEQNIFPYWEYNESKLWEFIAGIIKVIESDHVSYIHSPICRFDAKILIQTKQMLLALCQKNIGICSLSEQQTNTLLQAVIPNKMILIKQDYTNLQKVEIARNIVEKFENLRTSSSDLSFTVINQNRFVPPHEYQVALNFLNSNANNRGTNFFTREIKINIIGGCLNSGWQTVKTKSTYHQIIRQRLKNEHNIRLKMKLDHYGEFFDWSNVSFADLFATREEIKIKMSEITANNPDCLIFQIRPFLYSTLSQLFLLDKEQNLILNPWLLGERDFKFNPLMSKVLNTLFKRGKGYTAYYLGLHRNAAEFILGLIIELGNICLENRVKLFILNTSYPLCLPYRAWQELDQQIIGADDLINNLQINFMNFKDEFRYKYFFEDDLLHFNQLGHAKLAELLYPQILDWIESRN